MSNKRDYYEVIGCARDVSPEDLRKAYKREALKYHPDRNPGDASAETRFKEVNEAYQVLSDEQRRQIYDQFGHAGLEGGGRGGPQGGMGDVFSHMQDFFSEMFSGGFSGGGRQRRGADLRVQSRLTLKEAGFGCKREVSVRAPTLCNDCDGSGAKAGTRPEACPQCRGTGQVSSARGAILFTAACGRCQGQGAVNKHPCKTCSGAGAVDKVRKVMVTFPAGIDNGQRLRIQGHGVAGPQGVPPGDLFVEVEVEDDSRFERDGADLLTRASVTITEATLGAEIEVPVLSAGEDEFVTVHLPPGTQPGSVFNVKGQGLARLDGRGRGSLSVLIQVSVPTVLTERARELMTALDDELRAASVGRRSANSG